MDSLHHQHSSVPDTGGDLIDEKSSTQALDASLRIPSTQHLSEELSQEITEDNNAVQHEELSQSEVPAESTLSEGEEEEDPIRPLTSKEAAGWRQVRMDGDKGIVRWSPNQEHDRFITMDFNYKTLKLHEATGHVKPELFEHKKLSKHTEVPALTAYDWSPTIHGLVAAGTRNGEVHLLRVDDDSNATLAIPVKLQRTCNAVSFNKNGLLAIGLDRVRNDPSLQIWDINQRLPNFNESEKGWPTSNETTEPLHRLEPQVHISSVKFFEDQPNLLAVGIKASSVRIHDLRVPGQAVITFPTRCNNNLAIDYADPNYFASSSINEPTVMVWDRRATNRSTAGSMYLESVDADDVPWGGALKLEKVIEARPHSPEYIRSVRFSRDRAGCLAMLSNTGELKVFNLRKEYIDDETYTNPNGSPELLQVRTCHSIEPPFYDEKQNRSIDDRVISFDWLTIGNPDIQARMVVLRAKGATEIILTPKMSAALHSSLLFFDGPSNSSQPFYGLPTFADPNEQLQNIGPIVASHDVVFGNLTRLENPITTIDDITQAFASTSLEEVISLPTIAEKLIFLRERTFKLMKLVEQASTADLPPELQRGSLSIMNIENTVQVLEDLSDLSKKPSTSWGRNLLNHYSVWGAAVSLDELQIIKDVVRRRCEEGYLFDCKKNRLILSDDPWLQDVWDWVAGAEEAAEDGGMVVNGIDLSYLGVHAIWTRDLGLDPKKRLVDLSSVPAAAEWERAIGHTNKKAGRPKFDAAPTIYPHHRQLCLSVCGFSKSSEEFDNELETLQKEGLFTKAAAWSLFEGNADRAVKILNAGGNHYMFIALALELRIKNNELAIAADESNVLQAHDDPYLRAIYALIKTGRWKSVADEMALPMRDRVWVALCHFNDRELSSWLEQQMTESVKSGDIEAIVLSGISIKLVDVLVKYIEVVGDYQTALLITSFALPLYGQDFRMEQWRTKYHQYLNTRKMFVQRAMYDIRATRMSKRRIDGVPTIQPAARQVTLRCVYCDSDLDNNGNQPSSHAATATAAQTSGSSTTLERNPLMTGLSGIQCPRCGRHLPRCAICDQYMGMPRTDRRDLNESQQNGLAKMLTWCLKCSHGFHFDHAQAWFERHIECPVDDCRCQCGAEANPELA